MWIDFKITNRCNNRCTYCGVSHDKPSTPELVPINYIIQTIKSSIKLGFDNFAFLGGEPTLREDVDSMFSAFNESKNVNVLVITNGLVFRESLVRSAFSSKASNVNIVQSFDSFEIPNYKHQNPTKIIENINKIREIAEEYSNNDYKRGIHIHSVISRENYIKIYELVDYFFTRNIDISLGLVCPSLFDNTEKPTNYNHFNFNELKIIMQQFSDLKKDGKLNFANNVLYEYLSLYPFGKVEIRENCKAGKEHIIINPDGEVYPCITQSYAKNERYGNITTTPFDLIYKNIQKFVCHDDFAPACWDHYLWNKMN